MSSPPTNGIDCSDPANKDNPVCQNNGSSLSTFAIVAILLGIIVLIALCVYLYITYYEPRPIIITLEPIYT